MDLNHSFTVPASTTEAWDAFNQIESMAECFPGGAVTSVEGDTFAGTVKVKLGPISLMYSGTGTFLERDQATGRLVVEAKGKDKRGNGTAGATVTAVISDAGDGQTKVDVHTDLQITGKPAQFGRGVIQDVSDKLLQQFVTCLQSKVGAAPAQATDETAGDPSATPVQESTRSTEQPAPSAQTDTRAQIDTPVSPAPAAEPASPAAAAGSAPSVKPAQRVTQSAPESEALDLGATVVPILLKSYRKQLTAGAIAARGPAAAVETVATPLVLSADARSCVSAG